MYIVHNNFIVLYMVTCFTNGILRPFVKLVNNRFVSWNKIMFFSSCFLLTVFSSRGRVGRTKKLKAQITIDCVCLWPIATVSLASAHSNHNDRRSQGRVNRLSHLCFIEERGCSELNGTSMWQGCSLQCNLLYIVQFVLSPVI